MNPHGFLVIWGISFVPSAIFMVYIVRRHVEVRRTFPAIAKADIVYQENFASGASQKNWITKIGGARNCLRLIVTKDLLWVTARFPFGIFATAYDLQHVIPLDRISLVQNERLWGSDVLFLSYIGTSGGSHILTLIPKNRERFLESIHHLPVN